MEGGGGDGHLVDFATPQVVNGAGVGGGVAGGSVPVLADRPGGVVVRARGLSPGHVHDVGVALQFSRDIFRETGSCGDEMFERFINM